MCAAMRVLAACDNDSGGNAAPAYCGNGTVEAGEECDGGGCCREGCRLMSSGAVCRPSLGPCDVVEVCDGSSSACPTDIVQDSTTICRPAVSECDLDEACTGTDSACPEDSLLPDGTSCTACGGTSCNTGACSAGLCAVDLECVEQSACAAADDVVGEQLIARFPFTPVVDGKLDEEIWWDPNVIWHRVQASKATVVASSGPPFSVPTDDNDLSFDVAAVADSTHLYVAVRVRDDIEVADSTAFYLDDGIEFFVNLDNLTPFADSTGLTGDPPQSACTTGMPDGRSTLYDCEEGVGDAGQFANKYNGTLDTVSPPWQCANWGTAGRWADLRQDMQWASDSTPAYGYTAEFSFPFSTPGAFVTPGDGVVLGFDVAVNDDDDGGGREHRLAWGDKGSAGTFSDLQWCDPRGLSALKLCGLTCEEIDRPTCGNHVLDPGEECDGGACCTSHCRIVIAGRPCRPVAGPCDVVEYCNGALPECPTDTFVAAGELCRAAAGDCDLDDRCDGVSAGCADTMRDNAYVCRTSANAECDPAESCTGSAPTCPDDALEPASTACTGGFCDAGICVPLDCGDGDLDAGEDCDSGACCTADCHFAAAGVVCQASASGCDPEETCSGSAAGCPDDVTLDDNDACTIGGVNGTCASAKCAAVQDLSISDDANDAEESLTNGVVYVTTNSDLELIRDLSSGGFDQIVGLRFAVDIPQGATITNAYLQFQGDSEASSGDAFLTIQAEAADNAAAFGTTAGNISARARTTASVAWGTAETPIPDWPADCGVDDPIRRTPDIASVVQEVVGRSGWRRNNSMVLLVTGTSGSRRVADSAAPGCSSGTGGGPRLHLQYHD